MARRRRRRARRNDGGDLMLWVGGIAVAGLAVGAGIYFYNQSAASDATQASIDAAELAAAKASVPASTSGTTTTPATG